MEIHFFYEDTNFILPSVDHYRSWISKIGEYYHQSIQNLNYIFCSDRYLLEINQVHLSHDYFTDIITFDHSESEKEIEGDVFISVDRVRENSINLGLPFEQELSRVMAHGILHLIGFNDNSEEEKTRMREKEDACLSLQKQ